MKKRKKFFFSISNYICPTIQFQWWFSLSFSISFFCAIVLLSRFAYVYINIELTDGKKDVWMWNSHFMFDVWKLHFSQFITSNETINIINSSETLYEDAKKHFYHCDDDNDWFCYFWCWFSYYKEMCFIKMPQYFFSTFFSSSLLLLPYSVDIFFFDLFISFRLFFYHLILFIFYYIYIYIYIYFFSVVVMMMLHIFGRMQCKHRKYDTQWNWILLQEILKMNCFKLH